MPEEKSSYQYSLEKCPDYGLLTVTIPQGKSLKVEAGAMAFMDSNLQTKTSMKGGFKRMLSGEKLFINEYSAPDKSGDIGIAPATPGDIKHLYLEGNTVYLQNSSYLASSPEISIEPQFQGFFKGLFSGESLFLIKAQGTGDIWFNTYGALIPVKVTESYVIDTGYIVGFTDGLDYKVETLSGFKSLFFSGEGLVCRFSGTGTVWIQTRLAPALVSWADAYRRVESKSSD